MKSSVSSLYGAHEEGFHLHYLKNYANDQKGLKTKRDEKLSRNSSAFITSSYFHQMIESTVAHIGNKILKAIVKHKSKRNRDILLPFLYLLQLYIYQLH